MKRKICVVLVLSAMILVASIHEVNAAWGQETRFVLKVFGRNMPVAGAKVFIDGEFRGITDKDGSLKIRLNVTQRDISPGSRIYDIGGFHGVGGGRCVCIYFQVVIRIEKEEFKTYEDTILIPYNMRILTYFVYMNP